jgi:hypothetical protein
MISLKNASTWFASVKIRFGRYQVSDYLIIFRNIVLEEFKKKVKYSRNKNKYDRYNNIVYLYYTKFSNKKIQITNFDKKFYWYRRIILRYTSSLYYPYPSYDEFILTLKTKGFRTKQELKPFERIYWDLWLCNFNDNKNLSDINIIWLKYEFEINIGSNVPYIILKYIKGLRNKLLREQEYKNKKIMNELKNALSLFLKNIFKRLRFPCINKNIVSYLINVSYDN